MTEYRTKVEKVLTLDQQKALTDHYRTQFQLMHRRAQKAEAALITKASEWNRQGFIPPEKVQQVVYAAAVHDLNNTTQLLKITQDAAIRQNEEHQFCVLDRDAAVKALSHLIVSITGKEPVFGKDTNYMQAVVETLAVLNKQLEAINQTAAITTELLKKLEDEGIIT